MNFFKALISWKLWLAILLGVGLLVGLWFFTFNYLDKITNHGVEVEVPNLSEMTIHEAITELDKLGLEYEVDSVKFTEEHPPFSILEYFPAAGEKVKPGRRVFIISNPSTWRPMELPDFIHKSKRLAITQLEMRGFKLGDTIYVRDPAKDAVLGVLYNGDSIKPGKLLPRGSKIDLILGRGLKLDVSVPSFEGLTLAEAKARLKEYYFDIGQVYHLGMDSADINKETATVVYQDPPTGDVYDEGLPISFWISTLDRSQLRKQIDSLDIVYRRKINDDSIFFNSVQESQNINLRDLPEEIRNQVKYDQATNEEMRPDAVKPVNNEQQVDTNGISIDDEAID